MVSVAVFDFRCNKDYYGADELVQGLNRLAKHWCFQGEVGDGGYSHWQGRLSLKKKRTVARAKRLILDVLGRINYIAPTADANARRGLGFYAHKEDTYDGQGRYSDKDPVPEYVPVQYRVTLRGWQQAIVDSAEERNDRVIDVLIDPVGGIGKSILSGVLRSRGFPGIPSVGDAERLIYTVCNILRARDSRNPKLLILDLPRCSNKQRLHAFMVAIETIKNGWVWDTRYKYTEWTFDAPRVWIMSNSDLPEHYMTNDRWRKWEVLNDVLVPWRPPTFVSHGETISLAGDIARYLNDESGSSCQGRHAGSKEL